jgi:hypothetical protein
MMSSSPSTVLNLILDLNSQAHAPPPGVLKTLDLVAGAPHYFDLHLRVLHGSSVLKFSFNGLEDAPARATVELPNLGGSTKIPETYERQSLRNETMNIDEQRLPQSNNDKSGSLNSDEPLATQKRQRRKPLHHPVIGNDSYGETSDENSSSNKSHKRRHLRRKRPARGAYIEPPKDLTDIFEPDTEIFNQPLTNTTRSNVRQAPVTPTPQNNLDNYGFRTAPQTQGNRRGMPDLYMGLDSKDNLDANLTHDPPSAERPHRFQSSRSPKRDLEGRFARSGC